MQYGSVAEVRAIGQERLTSAGLGPEGTCCTRYGSVNPGSGHIRACEVGDEDRFKGIGRPYGRGACGGTISSSTAPGNQCT